MSWGRNIVTGFWIWLGMLLLGIPLVVGFYLWWFFIWRTKLYTGPYFIILSLTSIFIYMLIYWMYLGWVSRKVVKGGRI